MSRLLQWAMLATALGCGLSSGVFFAFSAFVMPALQRLSPSEGMGAMQSINRLAVTPAFMTVLFGSALGCAVLGVHGLLAWGERPAPFMLAASALFLVGTIGVTIAFNVPLNDALATVDRHGPRAAAHWSAYVVDWTAWNHVRAVAALAACGLLTIGLRLG